MSAPREPALLAQLREADALFRARGIAYALIGGIAVNVHGVVRATRDLDVMVIVEAADDAHAALLDHGYEAIDRRDDIASYVRGCDRLDILFARRPINRDLLARAARHVFDDLSLPVVPVEGLIGLKVQAFNDDPRRLKDLTDLVELFKVHRGRLDLDEVRSYFKLFDREALLDDLLRAVD